MERPFWREDGSFTCSHSPPFALNATICFFKLQTVSEMANIFAPSDTAPLNSHNMLWGARGKVLVQALCYTRKISGSRPDDVNNIFNLPNPSDRTK
jgi:hypothetical protein